MKNIKILQDTKGADDGSVLRDYLKNGGPNGDGVYAVSDDLARALIDAGEARDNDKKQTKAQIDAEEAARVAAEKAEDDRLAQKQLDDEEAARVAALGTPGLPPLSVPGA